MGDRSGAHRVCWRNLRERDNLENLLRREDACSRRGIERHGLDYSGSEQGQLPGACECGNEHSDSIKCEEFLDWLRNC